VAISKANFNSFNVTPTASKFITFNSSNNGLAADDVGGGLKLISTQTASSSSSLSFTSGIDSTYKEYIFKFINMHSSAGAKFSFNLSADSGSNYNVTKTSTVFRAYHQENGGSNGLGYQTGLDLAQGTGIQNLAESMGTNNDDSLSGHLHLFDPSNTTFVKHFIANVVHESGAYQWNAYTAGYGNTTSAIDAIQFSFHSGNIDSGVIKMYGVS
tara:strand:- start:273 stop:911 length:639 start_codon:yes stop_codon:yes gene_type:complete